jgi:hypothetical protein
MTVLGSWEGLEDRPEVGAGGEVEVPPQGPLLLEEAGPAQGVVALREEEDVERDLLLGRELAAVLVLADDGAEGVLGLLHGVELGLEVPAGGRG